MRMPDKHAFLSPSSSERWFNCTKSAWLCEQFPDLGSVFAAEGTDAHRLCEFLLHDMLSMPDTDPRPGMTYYNQEMEEAAQGYVQFIREKLEAWKAKGALPTVFVPTISSIGTCTRPCALSPSIFFSFRISSRTGRLSGSPFAAQAFMHFCPSFSASE